MVNVNPVNFDTWIRFRVSQETKDQLAAIREGTSETESEHMRRIIDEHIEHVRDLRR